MSGGTSQSQHFRSGGADSLGWTIELRGMSNARISMERQDATAPTSAPLESLIRILTQHRRDRSNSVEPAWPAIAVELRSSAAMGPTT